jgi:hypothetical protein
MKRYLSGALAALLLIAMLAARPSSEPVTIEEGQFNQLLKGPGWVGFWPQELDVDLTQSGRFYIRPNDITFGPGDFAISVSCHVMQPPSSIALTDLGFETANNRVRTNLHIYNDSITFARDIAPYVVKGDGSRAGDNFVIILGVPMGDEGTRVDIENTYALSGGRLFCIALESTR